MSLLEAVVEGSLNPDGTLALDQRPDLPAGRVVITSLRHAVFTRNSAGGDRLFVNATTRG